jgi:hypothetical protein
LRPPRHSWSQLTPGVVGKTPNKLRELPVTDPSELARLLADEHTESDKAFVDLGPATDDRVDLPPL